MYDMFAITRNKEKFLKRDKRKKKLQFIETDPLAPDTMQEIMNALDRIIGLTVGYLKATDNEYMEGKTTSDEQYQAAKDFLHQNPEAEFTLEDSVCQKKYGAVVIKPVQAYKMYRKIVKYFATRTLMSFCEDLNQEMLTLDLVERIRKLPLYTEWENAGGQIIPSEKIHELFNDIKNGTVNNWEAVHQFYKLCECSYEQYKVRYALYLLEQLYSRPIEEFSVDLYRNITDDVSIVAYDIYNASLKSREKDYTDYYRNMVYRSEKEMENVIGPLEDNSFLLKLRADTAEFTTKIKEIFVGLTK